jgi:hypothetical protein
MLLFQLLTIYSKEVPMHAQKTAMDGNRIPMLVVLLQTIASYLQVLSP